MTPTFGLPGCRPISTTSWSSASAWQAPRTSGLQPFHQPPPRDDSSASRRGELAARSHWPPSVKSVNAYMETSDSSRPLEPLDPRVQALYLNNPTFDVAVTQSDDMLSLLHLAGFVIANNAQVEAAVPPAAPATPSAAIPPFWIVVVRAAAVAAEDSQDEETQEAIPLPVFPNEPTPPRTPSYRCSLCSWSWPHHHPNYPGLSRSPSVSPAATKPRGLE